MSKCDKCGFQLPEIADFCPNCGVNIISKSVKGKTTKNSVKTFFELGLLGGFISTVIQELFLGGSLFFLPAFLSSIIVMYFYKTKKFEQALMISMTIYLFADAIEAGIILGPLLINNQPIASLYGAYVPTFIDIVLYMVYPITALVAGYIGFNIVPKKRRENTPIRYKKGNEKGFGGIVYSLKRKFTPLTSKI
jgi:hypothetical protein